MLFRSSLAKLPATHAVYHVLGQFEHVAYSSYAQAVEASLPPLPLEGVSVGVSTPVIYCPFGFGGWRGFEHPYGRDLASADALGLGVNIVLYSLTH